ncbi:General amino-acid permease GAP1 [Wickerhamiella sorbophila]|uniref:General amino-acid permease GAP1 n=1 Tax=Wickerhamiella sorbophila TaxID=45607 RepID=A0A2T0FNI0_9ASCO|nr:General amino-acid permease GAP1 [Wickerhamiella sorbophila]PRT56546.1 General amino-acid permease GAP1 [Wickerhamiella sorbophila]
MSSDFEKKTPVVSKVEEQTSVYEGSEEETKGNLFSSFIDSFRPVGIVDDDEDLTPQQRAIAATTKIPLRHSLSNRHLQMIAIGGSIGAGLFVGSGNALVQGGPAAILISYCLVGVLMYLTMSALGEMGVRYPVNGVFSAYNTRFLDYSWGFAVGWTYIIHWTLNLPTEMVAAAVTIDFWKGDDNGATNVNKAAWVALFYSVIVFVNLFGVRGYGEVEVVMSAIKVIAVVGFIILGIVLVCGGGPNHQYIGGKYWGDPGAFSHGAKGVFKVFVSAAYAFSGTEFAGLAAAETKAAHKALPKATKQVFWRILIFYVVSLTLVGLLVPYTEPRLGTAKDGSASPFVIAIQHAGISGLPSVFNTVILLSLLSVGNAAVFGSSRTIVSLAAQGQAPRFFLWIDRKGRPVLAVGLVFLVGLIGFVVAAPNFSKAFNWLSSLAGLSGLMTWGSINLCFFRHRMALEHNGIGLDELEYVAPLGKWGGLVGFLFVVFVLIVQFWVSLFPTKSADAYNFFQAYLSFFIILALFVAHKLWTRHWSYVRVKDIDVTTGVRVADREQLRAEIAEEKAMIAQKNIFGRLYHFFC